MHIRFCPARGTNAPGSASLLKSVVGTDAGVAAPSTDILDATDLANILAYGVERVTANELCARHLGAPADRLPPPLVERSVYRVKESARVVILVAAVGILVFAVVINAGGSLIGSPDTTGSSVTPAAPATEPSGLRSADDRPPPGVGDDRITDISALADTHAEVVDGRSHTIWYDCYQPRNLDSDRTRAQRDINITAEDDRYLVETTEVVSGNETYLGAVYRDGGVIYTADWSKTTRRHEGILRVDRRNVLVPTAPDLRKNLVVRYLSTPRTNVTGKIKRDEVTAYRVVGQGAPNSSNLGEVQNYSVVALVDSRGLVRNLTVRYVSILPDCKYRITIHITYGRIGETTVAPPAWFENQTRSEQAALSPAGSAVRTEWSYGTTGLLLIRVHTLIMSATLDHTMIRVEDLNEALDWYCDNLGWVEHDRWTADTFTNVYLGPPDSRDEAAMLELTYNHGDHTYDFGDAWGHIALRVRDVDTAYKKLMQNGVEDYRDPESCGGAYAFVKDPDGHEVELIERDYGARWSLDHTMIRVEDVFQSIGWYTRVLDYVVVERREYDTFALYFMKPADASMEAMSIELTYNYDGRSYDSGDAWGHVCIRSEDLHTDWNKFVERGAADHRDPASCDELFAFTKDPDAHEIEILDRDPEQDSLFPV